MKCEHNVVWTRKVTHVRVLNKDVMYVECQECKATGIKYRTYSDDKPLGTASDIKWDYEKNLKHLRSPQHKLLKAIATSLSEYAILNTRRRQ